MSGEPGRDGQNVSVPFDWKISSFLDWNSSNFLNSHNFFTISSNTKIRVDTVIQMI